MDTNSEKMYRASQKMFKEGKVKEGISTLENIITKNPNYLLAYCTLGRAYTDQEEYHKAEHILLKAASLNPRWHLPHLHLGWAYEKQQKLKQALASYRRATRLNPDDFYSRVQLGYILQQLGDQEAGVNELQTAYQLNPRDIALIHNLANGLHKLDRPAEAIKLLDFALQTLKTHDSSLAHLYNLRGSIYLDLGELGKSLVDIQKAIAIDPTVSQFYNKLGDVYFEKGDYEEAINSYNRATKSDDEKGEALKGIGRSYLSLENWEKAVEFFEKAQEAGTVDYFGLGVAYFEQGDDERGIENLKNEILNNGIAKAEASYYLGFAYAAVGDHTSSVEVFKQFLELSRDKANDPRWQEWRTEAKKQIEEQ